MAVLISLSGLPGVGKTTVARELAPLARAMHLRVDSVESALKHSVLRIDPAEDAGYLALAAVASDNLRLGFDVITDTVNGIALTRHLWAKVASAASASLLNVELVCSDRDIHRQRVEERRRAARGSSLPDWTRVTRRHFEPWAAEERLLLDTAACTAAECAARIARKIAQLRAADR